MRSRVAGVVLLASLVAGAAGTSSARADFKCPMPASAEDTRARERNARAMFDEGVQLEASDPEGALARYDCAATLATRPAIELRIGVVAERLHRDDVAIMHFERYLELAGTTAPDAESMRIHVRDLKAKRDRHRDGPEPTPIATTAPTKSAEPAPSSSPERKWLGFGLVGLGVVLATVGTVFLVDAKSKNDDVHSLPAGTPWASDDARGTYDAAGRSQTIGIVLLAIAPAAIVGGVVLLLTGASSGSSASSPGAARASVAHTLTLQF